MTESEKKSTESAGDHDPKTEKKILRQIEHYFGDYNLPKDKFLLDKIKENEGGWIDLETMLKFQRLAKLSEDASVILGSLKSSQLMEIDEANKKIRRNPEKTIPEFNEERKKELSEMTVYCKGFDKEIKEIDTLLDFFDNYEGVCNVVMRTWFDKNDKEKKRNFKGSVFATFTTKELAQAFMDKDEVKYKEETLIRKWQNDYFKEKQEENAEKRKAKSNNRKSAKDAKKAAAEEAEEEEEKKEGASGELSKDCLPKGSVMVIDKLNDVTTREHLKETLKADYDVNPEDIAFIYYQKGEQTAKLRFKNEGAAIKVKETISKSEKTTLKINDVEVEYKVLEGDEEAEFLQQCINDMNDRKSKNRGHKRRGGFRGGRGGKRQRT